MASVSVFARLILASRAFPGWPDTMASVTLASGTPPNHIVIDILPPEPYYPIMRCPMTKQERALRAMELAMGIKPTLGQYSCGLDPCTHEISNNECFAVCPNETVCYGIRIRPYIKGMPLEW